MKKKLYIHIGMHKTGTSAIQQFSVANSDYLASQGFYYPSVPRPFIKNLVAGHHLLPWYIFKHAVPDSFFGKYSDNKDQLVPDLIADIQSSGYESVVLSSEEFDRLNSDQVKVLREYFSDFSVQIIVYLRRKDSFVESLYQTEVLYNRMQKSVDDYIKEEDFPLNYYDFIIRWQNVFGAENVKVNYYCKNVLVSNDVVVDFYNHLAVDVKDIVSRSRAKHANTSVPFQYVSVILMLRRLGASSEVIDTVIRVSKKIGDRADKNYHFLSLDKRKRLVESGLREMKSLGLDMPDKTCFQMSEDEMSQRNKMQKFSALKQVFDDFESLLDAGK